MLNPSAKNRFLDDFVPFQYRVARIGLWNSLSQTLLKLTCPGVPDIYQGNDLWDFSLVDPDNQRPVEYLRRQRMFESVRVWGKVATLVLATDRDHGARLPSTVNTGATDFNWSSSVNTLFQVACTFACRPSSLSNVDIGKRMEQPSNVKDPQNHGNDHNAVQN